MNLLIAGCLLATAVNLILTAVVFRQLGIYVMGTARGMDLSGIPSVEGSPT